jgi:hypothetical protein
MNITSGMSCVFKESAKELLIRGYGLHRKTNTIKDESLDRFVFFYNRSKKIGLETRLQEVQ